jgi:hypothetical protein
VDLSAKCKIFIICFLMFLTHIMLFRQLSFPAFTVGSLWSLKNDGARKQVSVVATYVTFISTIHSWARKGHRREQGCRSLMIQKKKKTSSQEKESQVSKGSEAEWAPAAGCIL